MLEDAAQWAIYSANLTLAIAVYGCRTISLAARVAIGAVAPKALLVKDAGAALVGSKVDDAAIEKMVAAVRAACSPIDDKRGTIEYRVRVAGVLAERATRIALDRAKED